jgi:hypothetical protein
MEQLSQLRLSGRTTDEDQSVGQGADEASGGSVESQTSTAGTPTRGVHNLTENEFPSRMALNSQMELINWNRYWYSEGSDLPLDHLGFLADPRGRWSEVMYPNLARLGALKDVSCLVLLGEPGLGKSITVREHIKVLRSDPETLHTVVHYDLKDFGSELSLTRNLFDADPLRAWTQGEGTLELYLDSVDEGLLNVEALAGFLVQELMKLDRKRLQLRLVCRPAVWPKSLENELQRLWPRGTGVYRLTPLTRADVELAAKSHGVMEADFIDSIRRSFAVSFARKPLTLKMLLQVYSKEGGLPESITDLYQLGILALASEFNVSRVEKLKIGSLTAHQRVAVSERVAAVSILCNRRVIHVRPDTGFFEEGELSGKDLYGNESFQTSAITVNTRTLREALDTGVFRWRSAGRAEWDHLSYAEYLTASYLSRHNVPTATMKRMIMTTVDGQTRVAPQLKEMAAWVAMLVPEFRAYILRVDPLVLLGSDVTRLSPADRKGLVGAALSLPDEDLWSLNLSIGHLGALDHPAIAEQLRPYLTDRNKSGHLRRFTMEAVRDCRVNLDAELLAIASDGTEAAHLRSHAVSVLAEIGQEATRKKLVVVLETSLDGDDNDEIKGWVLLAVWPDHLNPASLFRHLTKPKNDHFAGSYRMFLHRLAESIHTQLPISAVPLAIQWIDSQPREQVPDALSGVQDAIIVHAWNSLTKDSSKVAESLARVVANRVSDFEQILRGRDFDSHLKDFSQVIKSDTNKRRALIRALIREFASRGLDRDYLFRSSVVFDEDVDWLISEIPSLSPVELDVVLRGLTVAPRSPAVLAAISRGLMAGTLPASFTAIVFVEFGSAEYKAQRSSHAQYLWYQRRHELRRNRKLKPTPAERVAHDLAQIEAGKRDWWTALVQDLTLTDTSTYYDVDGKPIPELPGWLSAEPSTQRRILNAAREFALTFQPQPDEFVGKSSFPSSLTAAYQALLLVGVLDRNFLSQQDAVFWSRWLPFLLWYPFSMDDAGNELIVLAAEKARSHLPNAVLLMTRGDQHNVSRCIRKLQSIWASDVEDILAGAIARVGLTAEWTRGAIEELASRKNEVVVQHLVAAATNHDGAPTEQGVYAAAMLMRYVPERVWANAWPRMTQGDEDFGRKLVESLASGRNSNFFSLLKEDQLADLFIWTALRYPPSEDPKHEGAYSVTLRDEMADFRNAIPQYLASLGTPESIKQLARARRAVPEADWLKYYESMLEPMHIVWLGCQQNRRTFSPFQLRGTHMHRTA